MPLRQVRIGHDRLAELLESTSVIALPPIEQPQARVDLRIVGLELKRLLVVRNSMCRFPLALPGDAPIVIASWQFRALLDGPLKKILRGIQLLFFERFHTLENEKLGLRQARAKLVQRIQLIEFLVSGSNIPLHTQGDTQVVVCQLEIRLQLERPPKSSDRAGRVSAGL